MIDPQQLADMGMEASSTSHRGGPVDPIPTIVPTPTDYELAAETGFRTLWVVFVLLVIASASFAGLSWKIPVSRRVYHVITTLLTIITALSYFAMASGHGVSLRCGRATDHHKHVPDTHHEVCRQVYWARYVEWSLVSPLVILDLALLAGVDGAHTLMAIAADLIMVLSSLFAAYGRDHTAQRWGWFTISVIAYIFVIWHVAVPGFWTVKAKGKNASKLFGSLALFTLIVWTAYPIVWSIASSAHKATVDTEIIIYAVLDLLAAPAFGLWLLLSVRRVPETNIDIGGWWSHGLSSEGRIRIGEDEEA